MHHNNILQHQQQLPQPQRQQQLNYEQQQQSQIQRIIQQHHLHHQHRYRSGHHGDNNHHHNWRKSQSQMGPSTTSSSSSTKRGANNSSASSSSNLIADGPHSLLNLSAKIVAEHIPFQSIEQRYEHIPEPVQRRIIFWSFPRHEDDIKMYSSLSTTTSSSSSDSSKFTSSHQNPQQQNGNNNNNQANNQSPSNNNNSNRRFPWMMGADQVPGQEQPQNNNNNNVTPIVPTTSTGTNSNGTKNSQSNKQITFHKGLRLYNEGCVHEVLQVGFNLSGLISIKTNSNNQQTSNQSKIRGNHQTYNNNSIANQNLAVGGAAPPIVPDIINANPARDQVDGGVINQGQANNNSSTNSNDISPIATSNTSNDPSIPFRSYRVSVTFDRCKITSVSCSCELQDIFWCEHVVALILYRIRKPETIDLRVPISETLLSLDRQQLQKLVQYIIAEHHTEVLPTAQRLLDEMRQSFSRINQIHGAPDPTAGASADDENTWHLDEFQVNEKVQNYLNNVCNNSKDASGKQIHALFEKIREMFKAKDSNGTRLLKLMTEQFLSFATRNDKSRPLWDQLVSLWVIVMLNPDLPKTDKNNFMQLLIQWSRVLKCPKEDVERRVTVKRKAAELSDDEDSDDYSPSNTFCNEYPMSYNQSNIIPAHMATHTHRTFHSVVTNPTFPVLRSFNQPPLLPSTCPCQLTNSIAKKMRTHHMQHSSDTFNSLNRNTLSTAHPSNSLTSSSSSSSFNNNHLHLNQMGASRSSSNLTHASSNHNENRPMGPQEPRSIFYRAIDFQNASWDDPHLQLILNKDGPIELDIQQKSNLFDLNGNPLWFETISQAAARVETLKSHGYKEQALRLAVATVRRLKLQQDQWCFESTSDPNAESPYLLSAKSIENNSEGWIGHPFDPINVLVDALLEVSLTETSSGGNSYASVGPNNPLNIDSGLCNLNSSRCSCSYNQVFADLTHRLLGPDIASLSYQHRMEGLPILPLVNLAPRIRPTTNLNQSSNNERIQYYHVPVPGYCQKDSYLTLGVEIALIALGQQRSIPTIATAHDRAVRQEAELISKLELIDTSDPLLIDILKHQSTVLLQGGPFYNSYFGVPTDSAPLHTYAKYLFDSLVTHCPQLAYKVGVYALKMPLLTDENGENFGAARTSPRTINHNHLQAEQLSLAQTMLSKAKDEAQAGFQRKVYRASVKNIRNPASLLKLSRHVLKEAKPTGATLYPALLKTSFDLGLQVLKITLSPHTSNGKTRREAIVFIVECATDIGLEAVLQVMKDSREYFSAIEALNLVGARDNDHVNIKSQALTKLKLKENPSREHELNCRSRDLALDCANRDPTNCALEALKFCETDEDSLKRALKIIIDAGTNGSMDSTQLIKVADHIHERGMTDKAFDIAMVAVDSLSIPANSDNSSTKKDIFSACEYAQKVNGFGTLIPKLIMNIECATVLSEIYHRFSPNTLVTPAAYRNFANDVMAYNDIINRIHPYIYNKKVEEYKQQVEDGRWWTALLERTLKAFVNTTRTRLQNISPRHYGEFIEFLLKAQRTFEKAVDGPQQFKDLISEIMKSYRTKKKLMEKLKANFENSIKTT